MQRTLNFLFNLGSEIKNKKLSISFLIDLSWSMCGEPLEKVKEALIGIMNPLLSENKLENFAGADQVSLFTFHNTVQKVTPWVNRDDFDFFNECLLAVSDLAFDKTGGTALFDGISASLPANSSNKRYASGNFISGSCLTNS